MIELAVTLVVASIVITIAVSSFRNTTSRNQLSVQINAFVGAMQFARSEAIKRGVSVTMHRGRNVDAGGNFVNSGTIWQGEWDSGWEKFVDEQPANGLKEGNPPLRIGSRLPQSFTLRGNTPVSNRISFRPNGRAMNGSLVFCDDRDGNGVPESGTAQMIVLSNTGRVRIADEGSNGIPLSSGTEIKSCTGPFDQDPNPFKVITH